MEVEKIQAGKSMRDIVKEELRHIPRGNEAQNELRMFYWPLRMNSLGKKASAPDKTKEDILIEAINAVQNTHKGFVPKYNKDFFKA
jgi:hypothetical protein